MYSDSVWRGGTGGCLNWCGCGICSCARKPIPGVRYRRKVIEPIDMADEIKSIAENIISKL
ncbi:MAG: hypothetical protein ABFD25_15740 [Clostridiaceae bacterium]